jgi:hypothetical protein
LVGEIPAQLANCFSLVTLYVFCANFVLEALLIISPALNHALFSFQEFVIQQLLWTRPIGKEFLKIPNG